MSRKPFAVLMEQGADYWLSAAFDAKDEFLAKRHAETAAQAYRRVCQRRAGRRR